MNATAAATATTTPQRYTGTKTINSHCYDTELYTIMSALAKKQKEKGDAFVAEADQKLSKSKTSWFSSSKEKKYEEACELLEQAANAYKVGGFNQEAGESYRRAAEIHRDNLTNLNEASKNMAAAGNFRIAAAGEFPYSIVSRLTVHLRLYCN
jgi:hypothetical protein